MQLVIRKKFRETPDTVSLVLQPVEENFSYRAGQFLTLIFDNLAKQEVRRSYSLSSCPQWDPLPVITVKKKINGLVSSYLTDRTNPGDRLLALPPAGSFVLPDLGQHPTKIVLLGGGSGMTPLFSLLKFALQQDPTAEILLLNANTSEHDILFHDQLLNLSQSYAGRLTIYHFLSRPFQKLSDLKKRLAPARVEGLRLGNFRLEELLVRPPDAKQQVHYFLCGPAGLILKAEMVLGFLEVPRSRIHRERFEIIAPTRPPAELFPAAEVTLLLGSREEQFWVDPGQNILEAAEAVGLSPPFSCRSGSCTTCSATLDDGGLSMIIDGTPVITDRPGSLVLTCVAYPTTPRVRLSWQPQSVK